jgi:hypothetical protein
MLYQQNSGKLFQAILTVLVLGMTSACESEISRQPMYKDAETGVRKSDQRIIAAEAKINELSRKLLEAEKATAAAIETRQVAEQQLDKTKGEVTFHKVMNVIFVGLIICAFFAGLRQGERRRNDNDSIRKSMSDHPYIEMYGQVDNSDNCTSRSARS